MLCIKNSSLAIYIYFIILTLIQPAYQEYALNGKHIKYSEYQILRNAVQTFFHDANVDCKMDTTRLIQIYEKLLNLSDLNLDIYNVLLRHQMKRRILLNLNNKLTEAFYAQSMSTQIYIRLIDNVKYLYDIDKKLALNLLDLVVNNVYVFIDHEMLIKKLMLFELDGIQIAMVEKMLNQYAPIKSNTKILPLLTFYIINVFKHKTSCIACDRNIHPVYNRLPIELRLLYESLDTTIVLVNQAHMGYLPLLEASEKNFRMVITTNDEGFMAFGRQHGNNFTYLGVKDDRLVYYGNSYGFSTDQLWYVIWPEYLFRWNTRGLIMFQNKETKMLLCANKNNFQQLIPDPKKTVYENNFIQLNSEQNMLNTYCYWMFKEYNKM